VVYFSLSDWKMTTETLCLPDAQYVFEERSSEEATGDRERCMSNTGDAVRDSCSRSTMGLNRTVCGVVMGIVWRRGEMGRLI
jgi:hypothetical protein